MPQWDLGIAGLLLLAAMSLAFGLVAHLIVGRHVARWLWLYAALAYFVAGILVSEAWFGWATEEDLQPNIDGLSFDEVQLVTHRGADGEVRAPAERPRRRICRETGRLRLAGYSVRTRRRCLAPQLSALQRLGNRAPGEQR